MPKIENNVYTVAKRQLLSLKNEKTIVFAVLVQLIVALFSSFLVVGFVSIYDSDGASQGQEVEIALSGDATSELISTIYSNDNSEVVNIEKYETKEKAVQRFESGLVDAVIHTKLENNQVISQVRVPSDGFKSTIVTTTVQSILEDYEQDRRENLSEKNSLKILNRPSDVSSAPFVSFVYTVLLPLLVFLPSFISGSIVIDSLIQDRKTGMLEILRSTPLTETKILLGKISVPIALGPVQVMAWIILLRFNGITISRPEILIIFSFAITLANVGLALFVISYLKERGIAQAVYSVLILAGAGLTIQTPEAPNNTVAKIGLGSYDIITLSLVISYLIIGATILLISLLFAEKKIRNSV